MDLDAMYGVAISPGGNGFQPGEEDNSPKSLSCLKPDLTGDDETNDPACLDEGCAKSMQGDRFFVQRRYDLMVDRCGRKSADGGGGSVSADRRRNKDPDPASRATGHEEMGQTRSSRSCD